MSQKQQLKNPPLHTLVPGTSFTVDWHGKTHPKYIHSFLSHAHSDHTYGLASFRSPRILHCSPITSQLVYFKFPSFKAQIVVHPPNTSSEVDGITIHFFDANHTPGSLMFLFCVQNKKIFHTGDFRGDFSVVSSILPFCPVDHLYIDCTFALSNVEIPPRNICLDFVVEKVKEFLNEKYMIMIGTYTIGKEDLVYEVAMKTGKNVYANETRYNSIVQIAKSGWNNSNWITNDPSADIHLVSINECNSYSALEYCKKNGRTAVASFQVTGWSGNEGWQVPSILSVEGIHVKVYGIPYSDHSSLEELVAFVSVAKPSKIIPITQNTPKEIEKINQLFLTLMRKEKNKGLIDFYASEK